NIFTLPLMALPSARIFRPVTYSCRYLRSPSFPRPCWGPPPTTRRFTTMPSQAALLIGKITHARKEWEALSSILTLKVGDKTAIPAILCVLAINALFVELLGIPRRDARRIPRELQKRQIR
ncbi:hypothetical protein T310_8640, partial [Rasamsonia emersonii CBS 393.64]